MSMAWSHPIRRSIHAGSIAKKVKVGLSKNENWISGRLDSA